MHLFGVGDHGGGPTRRDILAKMELDKRPALPNLIFSSSEDFYDEILKEKTDYPVVKDELNPIFEGCYTTHSDIKNMVIPIRMTLLKKPGRRFVSTNFTIFSTARLSTPPINIQKNWLKK